MQRSHSSLGQMLVPHRLPAVCGPSAGHAALFDAGCHEHQQRHAAALLHCY
jgi:hypothetical protein